MISSLVSLSFLGLLFVPALVQAVQDAPCGRSSNPIGAGCDGKEICEVQADQSQKSVNVMSGEYGLGSTFQDAGLGQTKDLKGTIANIINIALGFLGIIAVVIILAGGFKWMTAGGNEDNVASARQMIVGGIIGLVVIFAAWAIASFVVANLQSATTA